MKKHLARNIVLFVIWCVLIIGLLVIYFNFKTTKFNQISNANSFVTLSMNKSTYNARDEVIATIKTNEKVTAISFYLNYDENTLSFKSADEGISIKDYPEQNLIKVIYFDLENQGRDTFNFKFNATKSINEKSELYLTNTAISTVSNNSYQQNDDEIKIGIQKDDNLIKTKNAVMISLGVAIGIDTVIFIISLIKSKGTIKGEKKDDKENNN